MFVVVFKKREDKSDRPGRQTDSSKNTRHPNWTTQYRNVNNGFSDLDSPSHQQSGTESNQKMKAVFGTSAAASTRGKQRKHKKKSFKKVKRFLLFGDCADPKNQQYYYNDPAEVPDTGYIDHQYIDDEENTHMSRNIPSVKNTSGYKTDTRMRQPPPVEQSQAKCTDNVRNVKSSLSLENTSSYKRPSVAISESNIRKHKGSKPNSHNHSDDAKSEGNIRIAQSSSPTLETSFPYESQINSKSTEFFRSPFKTEFGGSEIRGSEGYQTTNVTKHESEAVFTETFRSEKVISRGPDSQEPTVMAAIEKFHSIKNRIHSPAMTSSEQQRSGSRQVFSSSVDDFRKANAGSGLRQHGAGYGGGGVKGGETKAREYLPKASSQGEH